MFYNLDMTMMLGYLERYGLYFLFLIVFLEYLNLPGLPAGIIMPAAGILIARGTTNFWSAIFITVLAGVLGSLTLYILGFYLGKPLIDKIYRKYPKAQKSIDKVFSFLEQYGTKSVFIARLIPVARTLISIVAGTSRLNILLFLLYSTFGIFLWNLAFLFAGYGFGNFFFNR